ncbi:hypothetical protein E3N88_01959 [Mikania micrantha]|uniref:Protein kinase domain-containing protein n=1 Tax=Mikania micrantha TaxID=192012 RepID=A0A5N6Q2Z5_9ASTR|nr:hypothetical protein E3N88_01959 [Mikania micrantha]
MIRVFIFMYVILSCLPHLHSATYTNISMPNCPETFNCAGLTPFRYPFFNVTDTRCGLIKVNCTAKGGELQFGGRSYEIVNKSELHNNELFIHNVIFDNLVKHNSCEALMNNFTSISKKGTLKKLLVVIIIGSVLISILCFGIFIIWCHRKNNPFSYVSSKNKSSKHEDISILSCGVSIFSYEELEDATQNFDPSHELGDGGFGAVFYGKLQDGREVAVKKLHEHNYKRVQQFRNEVEILTKLRHPNLVVLYGCTSRLSRELLLVYEYVPNGTVADHLHGEQADPSKLTWPIRMNIAIETAHALVYLHASEIIHRDVKTNNILLDHNFCVKVADFGLSRLIPNSVTHVSTAPQGTPGYVDPQYHQCYQLTEKSDVYSFGVVLIELISSMMAVDLYRSHDEINLANLALKRIRGNAIDQLIDPVLGSHMNPEIMNMITSVAELAFQCLQYHSEMRPTMNEVLDVLMDIQASGGTNANDSTRDFRTMNVFPLLGTNDSVVSLTDFRPTPVSIASEWQSSNSESTPLSSNGDRLSMKNGVDT